MRLLLITLLSIFSLIGYGQEIKKVEKKEYKIGPLEISDDRNDSERNKYWAFYVSFQNAKYTTITDIESIVFKSFETFQKFATLMQDMIDMPDDELVVESGFTSSFNYRLNKYDFNKNSIYITNDDGAYTSLSKRWIKELNELVKTLE